MKIEKINDNQIRCTLTRADLAARHLKLSELAYGTEKAKMLFHDMMQQASSEFGFEADDIPLMIEAIPASPDSIVLIITKVDNPEELDTRFSKFAPLEDSDTKQAMLEKLEGADEFLDLLDKVKSVICYPNTVLLKKPPVLFLLTWKSTVRLLFLQMQSDILQRFKVISHPLSSWNGIVDHRPQIG